MEIQLVGATNGLRAKEDFLNYGRAAARVCYSKHDFDTLLGENDEKDLVGMTLKSGHHSPYDHSCLSLYIKDLPKFGAMLLNDERPYTSSEKSARYTQMKLSAEQKELYDKWMDIFQGVIAEAYPQLDEIKVKKLAQENARYMTSVFTPTRILHTLSFRDLNHIMHHFYKFLENAPDTPFNVLVKRFMREFNSSEVLQQLYVPQLDPETKKRHLRLFAQRQHFATEFGENYSVNYQISFACLAQSHRHRTLNYEMQPIPADLSKAGLIFCAGNTFCRSLFGKSGGMGK
ncbi:MAG: FAD-dependent thymidylate synthase [Nanoarchaeota archaeon]